MDGSANPYLLAGAVVAITSTTVDSSLRLPDEVTTDPALLPANSQPPRLPQSLPESIGYLEGDTVLTEAFDERLMEAFLAVRRAEVELFSGKTDEEIAASTRWRY